VREEVEVFKERAQQAFEAAREMFKRGYYDWAIVMVEQSLQLLLKYYLAREVGYFSKTHNLIHLIEEAGELDGRFLEFLSKNRNALEVVSDAYIAGRYLPRRYSAESVEDKFSLYQELLRLVEDGKEG